jgi:hypothetical protein
MFEHRDEPRQQVTPGIAAAFYGAQWVELALFVFPGSTGTR